MRVSTTATLPRMVLLVLAAGMAAAVLALSGTAWAAPCGFGCTDPVGAPTVTRLSPAPNSTTADTTPTISGVVKDRKTNLAKKNIKLFVDGAQVTSFAYSRRTDRLAYTPPVAMADAAHTVRIEARDADRKTARKAWTFTVDSACGACE
ncbi:hypothetical protein BH24ACT18_BH24ACT18_13140 [soil metagenome]